MLSLLLSILLAVSVPDTHKLHNVRLKVTPNPAAIEVLVEVGNENYLRSSTIYPDGSQSVYIVDFRDVPSGELAAQATERLRNGKIAQSSPVRFFVP